MNITNIDLHENLSIVLDEYNDSSDYFEGAYSEPILKWVMLSIYFSGVIPVIGLGFLIWFERSGQAGPYRTLINRLVSYNIEMVSTSKLITNNEMSHLNLKPFPNNA